MFLVVALSLFSAGVWGLFNYEMYEQRLDVFVTILTLSIISNSLTILYFVSFYRSARVSPGRVPDAPPWSTTRDTDELRVLESKRSGGLRFCRWCRLTKPDRAHHCRVCDMCVLKMDHHCPWLDNCIGFENQKFFLLTLFYGAMSLFLIAASAGWLNYYIMRYTSLLGIDVSRLVIGIALSIVCGALGIVVFTFFTAHVLMAIRGVTTVEVLEKGRYNEDEDCMTTLCCPLKDPKTGKPVYPGSIYKLPTILLNLKAAFGDDIYFWWLPTSPSHVTGSHDGLQYETVADVDLKTVEDEDDSPLIRRNGRQFVFRKDSLS